MKQDYKERRREERREYEKKLQRTMSRNWIICIGSLAVVILAIFIFK